MRRYSFKLYPNAGQATALEAQRRLHCDLYNGLLQERIDAYRLCVDPLTGKGKTLTYYDQCKGLTAVRAEMPEYAALSSDSMAATAQRVDRAFQAFFRRAKAGMGRQSGFPQHQGWRRYPGFSFKKHGSGWRLDWRDQGAKPANGKLYIKGVPGLIKFRGRLPARPEQIKTCDLLFREDAWWLSLVVEMAVRREAGQGKGEVRFDLVDSFACVKAADGGRAAGPEEAFFFVSDGRIIPQVQGGNTEPGSDAPDLGADHGECLDWLVAESGSDAPDLGGVSHLQTDRARCKRGSARYRKLSHRIARKQAYAARKRREALHVWTTGLARRFRDLDIVAPPSLALLTESGRGDARAHGAAVELKAMLNAHILRQAPRAAVEMLKYKLSEAGGDCRIVDDPAPPAGIGAQIVETRKMARRLRRTSRERATA